uniref:Rapsyn myristoylation/linker region N-terminal domain-containing protein n=1 Tax=Ciona savignyi TaxID=51511 RepID=H2ZGP1_CIOSA
MRAFMIYRKAAEKYKDLESPDQRLTGLVVCISKIKKLYKDKAYIGNATSIMKQMAKWLTKVQNPHSKMVAKGLHDIANFFSHGSENELAVKYYQMAITQMDKMFGHKAQTLNLYAQCHHNMGVVYKSMSKFKEAEYFFQKSVDLYKIAEDFDSEADKDETLRQSQDSVRKLRQMLGNPAF